MKFRLCVYVYNVPCVYVSMCLCVYVYICMCICVYMHVYMCVCVYMHITVSLWRMANARNVRLYYPYRQYTDLFIFRFLSLLCMPTQQHTTFICIWYWPHAYIYIYWPHVRLSNHLVHPYLTLTDRQEIARCNYVFVYHSPIRDSSVPSHI